MESMGAFKMAIALGLVALVASELTLLGFKERIPEGPTAEGAGIGGFFKVLKQVFADRQVLCFSIAIMLVQMTYQLMLMNVPYFTTLILGQEEAAASLLMGKIILIMALSTPLWYWLLARFPKRHVFRVIMATMAAGFMLSYFIGHFPLFSLQTQSLLFFAVVAVSVGGMFAVALGLIADLTDYDELKSGARREAVYYGIYGIVRKTGWAVCSLILAGVFSHFGYSVDNPMGVRVVWLVCAAVCLLGLIAFIPYKIGDNKEETRRALNLSSSDLNV
jgi:Na+/melibiose symporter-like transporter